MEQLFLYCHLFSDSSKGIISTHKILIDSLTIHIIDLKVKIAKALKETKKEAASPNFKVASIGKTLISPSINDNARVNLFFKNKNDIFCKVEIEIEPVKSIKASTGEDTVLTFTSLSNYSFFEANKQVVKVLVPVPGLLQVPKENITSNFTETSLEVKVKGAANGHNYRFAVPRLDAKITPEKCDVSVSKDGKLVIRLRKAKEDDHWTYLFKQKYVGEN